MTSEEIIDRTIFEYLRVALVNAGLLPDVNDYTNDATGYLAAIEAIKAGRADGAFAEVFGCGMWFAREETTSHRIVISRRGTSNRGRIGGFPSQKYEAQEDGSFNKVQYPDMTKDLRYKIVVVTKSMSMYRQLGSLIENVLGNRSYLPSIKDDFTLTGEPIYVRQHGDLDTSMEEVLERQFLYEVEDVWLKDFKVLQTGIPQLVSVVPNYDPNGIPTI